MEAVNKAIHTASHAIWGENSTQPSKTTSHEHEEPISGVQGKGAAGDPYDAGNREGKSSYLIPIVPILGKHSIHHDDILSSVQYGKATTSPLMYIYRLPMQPAHHLLWPYLDKQPGLYKYKATPGRFLPLVAAKHRRKQIADPSPKHPEQPEAPATDDNTAPQDPKLDGQSRNANSADAVTGSTTEESTPNLATATATATAGSSSSSSAEPSSANSNSNAGGENKEQRDQTAMGDHDHVSKEALQGPQGPAPRPAEEFEKDLNKSSKDEQSSEPGELREALVVRERCCCMVIANIVLCLADTSKGGGEKAHHSGNGKSNPMSKMKETLNKVTHPRHGGRQ